MTMNRRTFVAALGGAIVARPALSASPEMTVYKDPGCGCCNAWIDILRADGFDAVGKNVTRESLARFKLANGLIEEMMSCHTGIIEGYLIEGHVPPADIRRLLAERPEAIGLTVPGMPYGSPGMGPESEREAYDVFLVRKDGKADVFTRYDAA